MSIQNNIKQYKIKCQRKRSGNSLKSVTGGRLAPLFFFAPCPKESIMVSQLSDQQSISVDFIDHAVGLGNSSGPPG